MGKYIRKRILLLIPVILGVSLLLFVMMDMAPGDYIDIMAGDLTAEQEAELRHELGYDRSVFYRYGRYMFHLLQGDMGTSLVYKQPVFKLYKQRIPHTLKLAGASVLVCVVLSIPLGIRAAVKHGSLTDNFCSVLSILGLSMPNFWLGLMLIVLFGLKLKLLPASGDEEGIKSLILPAFTVGTGMMAQLMRTTRSSMLDVLRQDYLRTARSKGVSETVVVNKHALRNALIPIITVIGTEIGSCVGGATVTENVFTWPGIGRMLIDSIKQRDINTVTGILILTTTIVGVVQLAVDIIYAYVDPRLKGAYIKAKKKKDKKTGEVVEG